MAVIAGDSSVIPSEGAVRRRSRGIAVILVEGPLCRDDRDSSTARALRARSARNDLARNLRAEHVESLDRRRRGEKLWRLRHERLRDRSTEMSLSSGLIAECVEDRERRRPQSKREP